MKDRFRDVYFISGSAVSVELKTDKRVGGGNYEAYRLTVDNGKVKIVGASGTGLLNGFSARHRAADAMHPDIHKGRHCLGAVLNNIRNQGISCDFHRLHLSDEKVSGAH